MCEQIPESVEDQREMLTVEEVKQIMRIGTNAAYNLVHSKKFPVIKVGRTYRIPKASFFTWLTQSCAVNN